MSTGVILLNFGEPATPDRDAVVSYLERIFYANADLEEAESAEDARQRANQLANRRAPSLIDEYEAIGGSPLNEQAHAQGELLEAELDRRGYDATIYHGMQYTEPFIAESAAAAVSDGVDRIIGLPIFPLCGPSTNVLALDDLEAALDDRNWDGEFHGITGWHKHPAYNRLRAENLMAYAEENDLALNDEETAVVFSAHGTPTHYLEEGSRYDIYVEECCEVVASLAGVTDYTIGYQNHSNRDIPWTEPETEDVVEELDAERVVVEPISFLHEQSETLSELDIELDEDAISEGQTLYRVPVPHDDERIGTVFGDLVEPLIAGFEPGYYQLRQCQCRDEPGTVCLNAPR